MPKGGLAFKECPSHLVEWAEAAARPHLSVSAPPVLPPRVIASAPTQSEWLPFRRRDFEVDALARELIARAGAYGLIWGRSLPPSEGERIAASLPDELQVHFVCAAGHGDAMRLEIQEQLERVNDRITCTGSAGEVAATCEEAVDAATHVVVVVTDTTLPDGAPWMRSGSLAEQQLVHALRPVADGGKHSREIITIYDKPKGLDSTVFSLDGVASDAIKSALWGHEALVFRSKLAAPEYERKSMINEIVRRMCSKKAAAVTSPWLGRRVEALVEGNWLMATVTQMEGSGSLWLAYDNGDESEEVELPDETVRMTVWGNLRVTDLMAELRRRALSTKGRKADLVKRLTEADKALSEE